MFGLNEFSMTLIHFVLYYIKLTHTTNHYPLKDTVFIDDEILCFLEFSSKIQY